MSNDSNRNNDKSRNRNNRGSGNDRNRGGGGGGGGDRRRGGGGRGRDGGGGGRGRDAGRGRSAQGRQQDGGRGRPAPKAEFEFLVATERNSIAASVYATDVPPEWREIPAVMFFKAGLFLRAQGGVKSVAKDINFERAVVYAVWEDPSATFRFGGKEVRPGVTAAFLIPSPLDEGPPWLPLQAAVASAQSEMEAGFMSPSLDQVAAMSFKPTLKVQKNRLSIASAGPVEADTAPLYETLKWLADNPDDQSLAAKVARTMLVRNGHGLQRIGVSLMHRPTEEKTTALNELLRPLAPHLAKILEPLWQIWESPEKLDQSTRHEALIPLAKAVEGALGKNSRMNSAGALALAMSWMAGLFGVRAEKTGRQPSRTLFALVRAIRGCSRQMGVLDHPDSPLPQLPLSRGATDEIIRELSRLPREESNFERLLRALAIAECGWTIARPRREHLRPFRIVYPFLRGYPNASRSLVGRYDHIFTGWSFRGSELRDDGVKGEWLAGVFLTDSPSVTSSRAFARVVATSSPTGGFVAQGLKSTDHPTLKAIGEFRDEDDQAIAEHYAESLGHEKITYLRLQRSVAAAEYLVTRSEAGDLEIDFRLQAPHEPEKRGVRGHFMYWRMFCRSIAWKLPDVYRDFIDEFGPKCAELPPKLQTELFALVRRWAMHSDEHRAHAAGWNEWLRAAAQHYFDAENRSGIDGEWLDMLSAAIAACDRDGAIGLLVRLTADDALRLGHVERFLDGTRSAGWRRELVTDPAFAALHPLLVPSLDAEARRARVEWVRSSMERARHYDTVRWMLDARSYPNVVGSEAFRKWFEERGLSTINDPDGGLVELLELAVQLVSDEHLDIALRALDARTLWPAEEHLRALSQLDRPAAIVGRMRLALTGTADEHATAAAALFQESGGEALNQASIAVAHFETTRSNAELTAVLKDGLRGAFEQYAPHRHAIAGFRQACNGWMIAELGTADPATRFAVTAAKWAVETGDKTLTEFVGHLADAAAVELIEPAVNAAIGGDDTALGTAFLALQTPEFLNDPVQIAVESGKSQNARALRSALAGAGSNGPLDALVARAVNTAVQGGATLDVLTARLAELGEMGPSNTDTNNQDRGAQFAARRLETLAKNLTSALKRWSGYVSRLEAPLGEATSQLLAKAGSYRPGDYKLRADLLSLVGGSKDDVRTVKDPRRLLTSDFLDSDVLSLDAADFVALADALRGVSFHHGGELALVADRRNVGVVVPSPAAPEKAKTEELVEETATATIPDAALTAAAPTDAAADAEAETEPAPALEESATDSAVEPEADAPTEAEPTEAEPTDAEVTEATDAEVTEATDAEVTEATDADDASEATETEAATAEPAGAETDAAEESEAASDEADQPTEAATTEDADSAEAESANVAEAPATDAERAEEGLKGNPPAAETNAAPKAAKGPTAKSLQKQIQAAYGVDSDAESRTAMFGEAGVPVLLRHLAKRNGLQIGFGKVRNRPGVTLKWDRRNRL